MVLQRGIVANITQMLDQLGNLVRIQFLASVRRVGKHRTGFVESDKTIIIRVTNLLQMKRAFLAAGQQGIP